MEQYEVQRNSLSKGTIVTVLAERLKGPKLCLLDQFPLVTFAPICSVLLYTIRNSSTETMEKTAPVIIHLRPGEKESPMFHLSFLVKKKIDQLQLNAMKPNESSMNSYGSVMTLGSKVMHVMRI